MVFVDSIGMALKALLANKLRAILTMLGIIIGVGAVIALVALGEGVTKLVESRLQSIGSNLLFVAPGSLSELGGGGAASVLGSARAVLTMADVEALQNPGNAPHVARVSPEISTLTEVGYRGTSKRVTVAGVWPNYPEVRNFKLAYGSFISERDLAARSTTCVLGPEIASDLFGDEYPIGNRIRIRGLPYTVVGVLEGKGGSAFADVDSYVYIPLSTGQVRLLPLRGAGGELGVNTIYAQASSEADLSLAADEIAQVLRREHRIGIGEEDDFTVINQADLTAIFGEITGVLTTFLGAIAGISLVVGGIGIMNIMLVSVTERTREIGIRKAVGAKRRDILLQFLVEAVFLALVGGLIGVLLGWAVASQAGNFLDGVTAVVTPETILLAGGVSAAVGVFFGIYPARRAAALNPIEALRYE